MLSHGTDNCRIVILRFTLSSMNHALENPLRHLQFGETRLANGVEGLFQSWQASTGFIGKLCASGAERWQAAIRQIQAPVNCADILRARTFLGRPNSP